MILIQSPLTPKLRASKNSSNRISIHPLGLRLVEDILFISFCVFVVSTSSVLTGCQFKMTSIEEEVGITST
jgi:hypothetical protein